MNSLEALQILIDGNQRHIEGKIIHRKITKKIRNTLVKGQKPYAVILSCSDSRVAPDVIFHQKVLGGIFSIRNAANILDQSVISSIEFGVGDAPLINAPLLVILGHEGCGGILATLEYLSKKINFNKNILHIINSIAPAVKSVKLVSNNKDFIANCIQANVKHVFDKILDQDFIKLRIQENKLDVAAAYYSLETGKVSYLAGSDRVVKYLNI